MSLRRRVLLVAMLLAATALADLVTNTKASMSLFYVLISFLGGWYFGQRGGVAVALINTAAITFVALSLDRFADQGAGVIAWNLFMRVSAHLLYATIASGLRHTLETERWLASYDSLTGALTVRAFHARMEAAVGAGRRERRRLLLAYLDLDGFKSVNDRFGHAAGDGVLQGFAAAAASAVREDDLFARVGGDEFAVVMTIGAGERGEDLAGRIHARLSAVLADTGYPVTCSMGAVVLGPDAIATAAAALARADALMYEAKESGRNALRLIHLGALASPARALIERVAA